MAVSERPDHPSSSLGSGRSETASGKGRRLTPDQIEEIGREILCAKCGLPVDRDGVVFVRENGSFWTRCASCRDRFAAARRADVKISAAEVERLLAAGMELDCGECGERVRSLPAVVHLREGEIVFVRCPVCIRSYREQRALAAARESVLAALAEEAPISERGMVGRLWRTERLGRPRVVEAVEDLVADGSIERDGRGRLKLKPDVLQPELGGEDECGVRAW